MSCCCKSSVSYSKAKILVNEEQDNDISPNLKNLKLTIERNKNPDASKYIVSFFPKIFIDYSKSMIIWKSAGKSGISTIDFAL